MILFVNMINGQIFNFIILKNLISRFLESNFEVNLKWFISNYLHLVSFANILIN